MTHKETLKPAKGGSLSVILMSLGIMVLLITIIGISNLMYNRYGINHTGYVVFFLFGLIGIYVYRRKILKYQYTLIKNQLIFETLVGKRSREIARVALNKKMYFCPISEEQQSKSQKYKNYNIMFKKESPRAYVIAYEEDQVVHRVVFEPSDKLIKLIQNS